MITSGQRWFLVIVLGLAFAFFIIAAAIPLLPSKGYTDPSTLAANRYQYCMTQASVHFSGDQLFMAIKQCKELFDSATQ